MFLDTPEMFAALIRKPLELVLADTLNQGSIYYNFLNRLANIVSTDLPRITNKFEGLNLVLINVLLNIEIGVEVNPVVIKTTDTAEYLYLPNIRTVVMHSKLRYLHGYSTIPDVAFEESKWLEWLNVASKDIEVQLKKNPNIKFFCIQQHSDKTIMWSYSDNEFKKGLPDRRLQTLLTEVDVIVAFRINLKSRLFKTDKK